MHPDLEVMAAELRAAGEDDPTLALRFGLACVEPVAGHLESDEVIAALQRLRACLALGEAERVAELRTLAELMARLSASHPGSKSIDGSRHAAVSATYALARAVKAQAL